jgi:hypothetical protein
MKADTNLGSSFGSSGKAHRFGGAPVLRAGSRSGRGRDGSLSRLIYCEDDLPNLPAIGTRLPRKTMAEVETIGGLHSEEIGGLVGFRGSS